MTIKNHRNMLNAILGLVLLVGCIYVLVSEGLQVKYLIGSVLSVGLIVVNFIWGGREEGVEEMIIGQADERDLYNAMKSSRAALRITNDICFISAIIFFLIYAIAKIDIYLNIGMTLFVVIVVMFIAFLLCDHYYEKHN
ncbi:hypothetical protein [Clostridium psychrophilum]|uniref:hypothetical protein n=1 Tax=Clostridium psychrophilum TaxID=132926 RepID=UPI001C0B173B|nr:hypothetical protein [Clostridium psychrophilum]MBU3182870.1 hypothetical protein [Clostridium psychrophilum]